MKVFFANSENSNNTTSDYRVLEGSGLMRVNKSMTLPNSIKVNISDGGIFSSNSCEDNYVVVFKDQFGNISTSKDPYNDSSDDAGCNSYSYPITCRIRYKNDCRVSETKEVEIKFVAPGIYDIFLEEW